MRKRIFGRALVVLVVTHGAVIAAEPEPPELQLFPAQARVEVDASGAVSAVEPDAHLPMPVAEHLRALVSGWRFVPPQVNGRTVSGVTYVRLQGCAAPVEGGYRLAFAFQGNGPGREQPMRPPPYPPEALRDGASATVNVTFRVEPDGQARVEDIAFVGRRPPRHADAFSNTVKQWAEQARYRPEVLDGKPVTTRVSYPVEFTAGAKTYHSARAVERAARQELQQHAAGTDACQVALGRTREGIHPVALDSPFTLLPSG